MFSLILWSHSGYHHNNLRRKDQPFGRDPPALSTQKFEWISIEEQSRYYDLSKDT